ncbi:MAG: uridine kinase [Alicyclobacillus sp.]|nr:uridine kinase [Alicyclobacillus sp.]
MLTVGIAGGTGSGKTTVACAILDALGPKHVALLSQDAYYKDHAPLTFDERRQLNYDHPDSFDNELLCQHLDALRAGAAIEMPVYDFAMHARRPETIPVPPKPVVVLEGIHVLVDERIRAQLDIKVYVDTDADVRVLRRVLRDIQERGRTIESVYEQYVSTVKPMHDAFIEPSKRYADLIVPEGGENKIAISLLTSRIRSFLSESLTR